MFKKQEFLVKAKIKMIKRGNLVKARIKMIKRGNILIILSMILVLSLSLISAGVFSDFWDKITGKATEEVTSVNITVGNSPPTIPFVQAIDATNPTDDTTTSITFNYTATDVDGFANIDNTTADAYFQRAGESTRSNTSCMARNASTNSITFTCMIDMWYFDENGAWTINATIQDINVAYGENSSTTFTYNQLPGMKMSPTSLTWPEVSPIDTDTGSDNDPIQINNTGNDIDLNINVTALNLQGETTATQYIYANNFTVEDATEGCAGTAMVNASSINVTTAILQRGNHSLNYNNATSGQEQTYFCLKGIPQDISAQSYSSAAYGAWTIEIVS